jgi:flagellar biosynthesis/type III secretory pathway chaperone
MNWEKFLNYGDSYQEAFETLCNQLFERFLKRTYKNDLVKFRVINSAGGDGGIEAYGELTSGEITAVQAKWFRNVLQSSEIGQIRKSIIPAKDLRPQIKEYIICIPRDVSSLKYGRGKTGEDKKPINNYEEKTIDNFTNEIITKYPDLKVTWWFENVLETELMEKDNEGVHKFWFEKEIISLKYLISQFDLQRTSWLFKKYVPELHGQGFIQKEIQQLLYNEAYRKTLYNKIEQKLKPLKDLVNLIQKFIRPLEDGNEIKKQLESIYKEVSSIIKNLAALGRAILNGENHLKDISIINVKVPRELIDKIEKTKPSNLQIGVKERLINILVERGNFDLTGFLTELRQEVRQVSRLFLGNPGTGKTHALSNSVDSHLNRSESPSIIIRVKGTPCENWTQILKKSLEIDGWNKEQILSALETLSIRHDNKKAEKLEPAEELNHEPTKVLICVDGLEEDTVHWLNWYERIRESLELVKSYPRTRFIYTARKYFLDESELPSDTGFKVSHLPQEGDVPVSQVVDVYFSPEHYNIKLNPKSLIRGIDSLYALRLFCELYRNLRLTEKDEIITAEKQLLNEKIDRINRDFQGNLASAKGSTRNPIKEALIILSETFYSNTEVEHNDLFDKLNGKLGKYLTDEEVDRLIDYLSENGFIIRSELQSGQGILSETKFIYNLAYQSIMELIMADKIATAILSGRLNKIPSHLFNTPKQKADIETSEISEHHLLNQRIVQNIVNTLFHEHGKLIGQENYLSEGIEKSVIFDLQLNALIKAPAAIAKKYKQRIDELFLRDYKSHSFIFEHLIYPSANSSANYFGADYLHKILIDQPSSFEREEKWLGGDRYGINEDNLPISERFYHYDLQNIIDPYVDEELELPEFALHNEYPLIFGWALSTLDQSFRERLRLALTKWALKQPNEFIALIDKLFFCNDPQIQEDLASIMLGVASKIKDKEAIKLLAEWVLKNIFSEYEKYKNVIIREGLRSIVERALQYGLVGKKIVAKARPHKLSPMHLLPLDKEAISSNTEEVYPIVHDLAWYVIHRSFDDFLELGSAWEDEKKKSSLPNKFLKSYLEELGLKKLGIHTWAKSAAIAYMRSLGFSRTEGNWYTKATHGSKSKIFTLEEKYTWLAVHYLQGYLSDYLPLKNSGKFINNYMQIIDIPNPSEFINMDGLTKNIEKENDWIIPEELAPQVQQINNYDEAIRKAVENEPSTDLAKWLQFKKSDFLNEGAEENLLALFNYTSLHDQKEYLYRSIDARAVIIEKGQAQILLDLLLKHPKRTHFVEHIDRMVGSPQTDTYSNPTDVVWMNWIDEEEFAESYDTLAGQEKKMMYSVTSVTRNTVSGESEIYIPSKFVRSLLGIIEMNGDLFFNREADIQGYLKILKSENYDTQEMLLVPEKKFLEGLEIKQLELVWFIDLFTTKNALNESIKSERHPMKTRKYFVYLEAEKMVVTKIWDARFSNTRD